MKIKNQRSKMDVKNIVTLIMLIFFDIHFEHFHPFVCFFVASGQECTDNLSFIVRNNFFMKVIDVNNKIKIPRSSVYRQQWEPSACGVVCPQIVFVFF